MSDTTRAVAPDISKNFGRICHAALLHKLTSYGICSQVIRLTFLFVSHKLLLVILNGEFLLDCPVNPFVPNALFLYPLETSENLMIF